MPAVHPELSAEQAYVTRAWDYLDRGLADAERGYINHGAVNRATQQAMHRALEILRASRGGDGPLIAGRMDQGGNSLYIGRRGVYDHNHDRVVISWHAPAASRYFEATSREPHGVELKRVFVEEGRQLKQIFDEIVQASFQGAADDVAPTVSDALLAELDRSRDGAMREVVATIQAEQYRIIRSDRDGVVVVQGGPGTGKTVIGLHRAVWLAFNHADLRRQGILVVAPNTTFLSYVSGVLPSLDARDLQQADLASLYAGEAGVSGADDMETARVKGSERMAAVLARALASRIGWAEENLQLSLGADRFSIPSSEIRSLLDDIAKRPLTYADARDVLRPALSALAFRHYSENQVAAERPRIANEQVIRRLSAFTNALDRMWPTFTPEELLRNLFGTQTWLVHAADGVLTADERARLFRSPRAGIAEEPWTRDDLFCLDELASLIYGNTTTYGHIVIDEAQDLSPMQARALARRCPDASFTVLGDLAQATGAWIRDDWTELTTHLADTDARVETLSIGYRVPAAVLELAARQLPLISPGLEAPTSIRLGRGEPVVQLTEASDLVAAALQTAQGAVEVGMTTAIIVADHRYDDILTLATSTGVNIGDGRDGDFSHDLTLIPASDAKGLEFDAVVLVAPDEILAANAQGRRLLYVAMTRPTQLLHIVHSARLPEGLEHLDFSTEQAGHGLVVLDGADDEYPHDNLVELIASLSRNDRSLVEQLVRRIAVSAAREHPTVVEDA